MARRKQPIIADALLDQLLGGADPKTAFAKDGLLDELKKALAERALNAEMDQHLASSEGNSRNGYGSKTVLTGTGKIDLEIPRDRLSTFRRPSIDSSSSTMLLTPNRSSGGPNPTLSSPRETEGSKRWNQSTRRDDRSRGAIG
jgi:hypothetical protein